MSTLPKLNIFIPAAGLGERLRPITDHIPKPLIPVLGKPMLQYVLERVSALCPNTIGVNLHHKRQLIEDWISKSLFSEGVQLFPEDPVLGTGGGLKNAEPLLKENIFLVHNSDVFSEIDLKSLVLHHLSAKNLVTLAVHDYPEFNNLIVDEMGFFAGLRSGPEQFGEGSRILAFTGIAVYSPEFLGFLPTGVSGVVNAWLKAVKSGCRIGTFNVSGCYWRDVGTPVAYARTAMEELKRDGESVYIHPSIKNCGGMEIGGYTVIEENNLPDGSISLRNCILLPGAQIESEGRDDTSDGCLLTLFRGRGRKDAPPSPPIGRANKGGMGGLLFENCILGPGFRIDLDESEMLGAEGNGDRILIGIGGSDREYFRVRRGGGTAIVMQCKEDDPDFERHIEYTRFFKNHSVPVPALQGVDIDKMSAVFEDLGDLSLYSWLRCPREEGEIETMYRRVLGILISIHTSAAEHVGECPLLKERIFDYDYLRWETDYFTERFLKGICNMATEYVSGLCEEFHRLAAVVDSFQKRIVHRDFQSQNIMITRGGIPRILDFQGARMAPPAYDVVSILWDPYYRLDDGLRERLLEYYVSETTSTNPYQSFFRKGGLRAIAEDELRESLLPCRLQRHMQALGAYGFLSRVKGKKYFLKHLPEGLRLLKEDVSLAESEYPLLYSVVMKLKDP
ncbi:MAG: phosphotransferase [Nitrospirota bacterium]